MQSQKETIRGLTEAQEENETSSRKYCHRIDEKYEQTSSPPNLKSLVEQLFYEGRTQIRDARAQRRHQEATERKVKSDLTELRIKVEGGKKNPSQK